MTNYLNQALSATGAATGRMDAGASATNRQFYLRVVSTVQDSVVALETSPDNSTYTEQCRVTGDGWGYAGSNHARRWARVNVISLGTGAPPLAATVCSYPT